MVTQLINRIFTAIECRLSVPRLRLLRTIYVNLRVLPFRDALTLPIFIYGKVHLYMLNGTIEIKDTPIKRGMIKIGAIDPFSIGSCDGCIALQSKGSKIIFHGPARIGVNTKIKLFAGTVEFGQYVQIGSGVRIICNGSRIEIGEYTQIPFDTIIMNSSFHSIYDVNTMETSKHIQPIIIGARNWIGNNSTILAGAVLKDDTIVATKSLVNKDFSRFNDYQLLGGTPARIIKTGVRRVFSSELEMKIINWFDKNREEIKYKIKDIGRYDITDLNKEF